MKNFLLLIFAISMFAVPIQAQVPQCINYQTVVRNSTGQLVKDQSVSLKFSILKNSTSGQVVYAEKHTITTNQFGIVNLKIGLGTALSGMFKEIDWSAGKSFLKIHLDLNGGTNFSEMGTTEMVSVPYALYAGSIYVHYSNDTLYIGDQSIYLPSGGGNETNGNTVDDYDGNSYNVVTIGTQIWLSSNLISTHYSDGTAINGVYDYDNSTTIAGNYGKLYTWAAAMNGATQNNNTPSGVQGVCPTGFHLPSLSEWEILYDYVHDHYGVGGSLIGKKLKEAGTTHWITANGNNETGFTALGAGHMYILGTNPVYKYLKESTAFWSATVNSSNTDQAKYFKFYDSGVVATSGAAHKTDGYPVRCIKD